MFRKNSRGEQFYAFGGHRRLVGFFLSNSTENLTVSKTSVGRTLVFQKNFAREAKIWLRGKVSRFSL